MRRLRHGHRSAARGFTLLEMLVVLSIVGLLMGLGIGVYLRLAAGLTPSIAVGRVKTLLRMARNSAVREGSPAVVHLDARGQSVRATSSRTVAYWHCEDGTGAFGRSFTPVRGTIVPEGRIGNGLRLDDGGFADCGTGPELDLREGLSIEAYVWPREVQAQTIVRKGDAYVFGMTGEGFLTGRVTLEGGTREEVVAETGALRADRWSRVGFFYNRAVLALYVDGRQVASRVETRRLEPDPKAPFLIGDRSSSFTGIVDEIRVREVLTSEAVKLPEEVTLEGEDGLVVFDPSGKLDPAWHSGPVRIPLRFFSGDAREIAVNVLGTVE
jgi:prepilin-type N-terminal cleavage/methylation domain-containing protein